jgi:indole-3-glycerol phosphate synthase/phosphoribosylanthranilate isomerase
VSNVRDQIVERRRSRIAAEGHTLGVSVPQDRELPLTPFLREPGLICEIKRRSPSRGAIDEALDPVTLAGSYSKRGVRSVSVLTEEDHFAGSLRDLIDVKRAHPDLSVLRKDFLIDREDIDVSYRAGADAILLIASVLDQETLHDLHEYATGLGLAVLVELHEPDDFEKGRSFAPPLVGINARDLATFHVDLLTPIRLRAQIDWEHRAVFESGAFHEEDGMLARRAGFSGLLVGEAAVRDQDVVPRLVSGLNGGAAAGAESAGASADPQALARPFFWTRLMARMRPGRPLVKICGITNRADAELAATLGADAIGMIFAHSPREVDTAFARSLSDLDVIKVAVVVSGGSHGPLRSDVRALLDGGYIDAVQFHGEESPSECADQAFPYYKAIRVGSEDQIKAIGEYWSPRVLVDARSASGYGGTGKQIEPALILSIRDRFPLWLAGGLSDENIGELVSRYSPELVDVSSGLEREPGKKDGQRMHRFFEEIARLSDG